MSLTLTDIKTQVSGQLNDAGKLIWTDALLETAIRSALQAIGRVQGGALTLTELDGAAETTLAEGHQPVLVLGAVAHALNLRVTGRFEDARASEDLPDGLADWAEKQMARFERLLGEVRAQAHQTAEGAPYAPWDWEEAT